MTNDVCFDLENGSLEQRDAFDALRVMSIHPYEEELDA